MAKVYDCCMFYAELEMLELRLNILNDVVDYFVVCEAAETHSGQPKPYNFADHQDRFDRWLHKIIYVQVDDLTGPGRNSWERERYHRARIADGLTEARPHDWVIVSDCDEIANPDVIATLKDLPPECPAIKLELDMYYYDLNHRVQQGWAIGAYRWGAEHDPNKIRACASWTPIQLRDAGWHFSYFGGPAQVAQKVDAFMHHADPVIRDLPRDPAYITAKMQAGVDLYGRDLKIDRVPLAASLPRYILDNLDKYRGWIVS